jgi:hypothetical protein
VYLLLMTQPEDVDVPHIPLGLKRDVSSPAFARALDDLARLLARATLVSEEALVALQNRVYLDISDDRAMARVLDFLPHALSSENIETHLNRLLREAQSSGVVAEDARAFIDVARRHPAMTTIGASGGAAPMDIATHIAAGLPSGLRVFRRFLVDRFGYLVVEAHPDGRRLTFHLSQVAMSLRGVKAPLLPEGLALLDSERFPYRLWDATLPKPDLDGYLKSARQHLEICWDQSTSPLAYSSAKSRTCIPRIHAPSRGVSRHSSFFLQRLLATAGFGHWSIAGGTCTDIEGRPRPHWWLEQDGVIVDLTADQRGHAPVIRTSATDPRYVRTASESKQSKVAGLKRTVVEWEAGKTPAEESYNQVADSYQHLLLGQ